MRISLEILVFKYKVFRSKRKVDGFCVDVAESLSRHLNLVLVNSVRSNADKAEVDRKASEVAEVLLEYAKERSRKFGMCELSRVTSSLGVELNARKVNASTTSCFCKQLRRQLY